MDFSVFLLIGPFLKLRQGILQVNYSRKKNQKKILARKIFSEFFSQQLLRDNFNKINDLKD